MGNDEEIRMSPGARRMTPGERIDAMVSPMETGIVSNEINAKGFSQKQTLQQAISAGDDWWAGDTIDLQTDTNALPAEWVQEQSAGSIYYRNTVTGVTTRTRPQADIPSSTELTSSWGGPGYTLLDENIDLAFPSSYESMGDAGLPVKAHLLCVNASCSRHVIASCNVVSVVVQMPASYSRRPYNLAASADFCVSRLNFRMTPRHGTGPECRGGIW